MDKLPLEKTAEEKLGEYLKRARMAAGIELVELAREIRITPDMLDHLENGRYEKLPVQAYVRGYLNTICTRLELNRAKVLDWYAGEVGRNYSAVIALDTNLGVSPSSSPIQKNNSKMILVIAAVVVVLLAIMIGTRKGDEAPDQQAKRMADSLDSVAKVVNATPGDSLSAIDTNGLHADSLADTTKKADSLKSDTSAKAGKDSVVASGAASGVETVLKFECIKDSTWIKVRRVGGLTWSRTVRINDKPRFLSHTDTMKVSIGSPEKTRMYINDEKIKIPENFFLVYNGKIIPKN